VPLAYAAATASEAPKPSKGKRWREEESADEDEGHDQCIIGLLAIFCLYAVFCIRVSSINVHEPNLP
jgi:hypothetical protein